MKDVDSDIKKALDLMRYRGYTIIDGFRSDSPIYKGTNENINSKPYIQAMKGNSKVLSVIGSGDQIINSILYGAKDIDAFDISRFPKYYLDLKLAAIKVLNCCEFTDFFYGSGCFDDEMFYRILSVMPDDSKAFWREIVKDSYPLKVFNSNLFAIWTPTETMAIDMNPFLSVENYKLVRDRIDQVKIRYLEGDIYKMDEVLDKDYDFANLSNIGMYANINFGDRNITDSCIKHSNFVKNLRIAPNGRVLNYLLDVLYSDLATIYDRKVYREKGFDIDYVSNCSTSSTDAVSVYRKVA